MINTNSQRTKHHPSSLHLCHHHHNTNRGIINLLLASTISQRVLKSALDPIEEYGGVIEIHEKREREREADSFLKKKYHRQRIEESTTMLITMKHPTQLTHLILFLSGLISISGFTVNHPGVKSFSSNSIINTQPSSSTTPYYHYYCTTKTTRYAGGFEWEDPVDDQGVENPFKNPELMNDADGGGMKIDPARLLGPRLQGCNLYFIGMMGTGKSSIGDIVARREFFIA